MDINRKEFIKSIKIFESLSDESISKLAEIIQEGSFKAGEQIFKEGDSAEDIFVIVDGEVIISKKVSSETEKVLSVMGPKSVFGEMGLFSSLARSASAKAKTELSYYRINCNSFSKVLTLDPNGAQKVLQLLLLSTLGRLEQTSRELATVYEISKIIIRNLPIREFSNAIITQICYSVPNIDSGIIYLWNEFTEEYDMSAGVTSDQIPASISNTHAVVRFISSRIRNNDLGTIVIYDKDKIKELLSDIVDTDNIIITPLHKENLVIGFILLLNSKEKVVYGSSVCDLMNSIGNQVIGAIENIKKKEEELAKERFDRSRRSSINW